MKGVGEMFVFQKNKSGDGREGIIRRTNTFNLSGFFYPKCAFSIATNSFYRSFSLYFISSNTSADDYSKMKTYLKSEIFVTFN